MLTDFGFKQVGILFLLLAIYLRDFDVVVPCVFPEPLPGGWSKRPTPVFHFFFYFFIVVAAILPIELFFFLLYIDLPAIIIQVKFDFIYFLLCI